MLPMYLKDSEQQKFLPTTCDSTTGRRMDAKVPFRDMVPSTALVYAKDIRCVCPDPTHMLTRCVEKDIKRMAQNVIDEKPENCAGPIRRFEEN